MTPTGFVPALGVTINQEPGLFFPQLMMGQRDTNVFPLYGEYKFNGNVQFPLFPTNGAALLAGAIGVETSTVGSTPGTATTLAAAAAAGATTISTTASVAANTIVQIDTPANNSECRKVVSVSGTGPYTLTLDVALTYAHASGASVTPVQAPFTHTVSQANLLPSFTIEKNVGGYQSEQFAGCRVNKLQLKAATGNKEVEATADVMGTGVAVLTTPSPITIVNESPYVFAEVGVSVFGTSLPQATTVDVAIENGIKETYTFASTHAPAFLTPVTRKVTGTLTAVFSSLTDPLYGFFQQLPSGGASANVPSGPLQVTFAHPGTGGSVGLTLNKVRWAKYADDLKFADVVMVSLSFEAHLDLTATPPQTLSLTVTNQNYLPF